MAQTAPFDPPIAFDGSTTAALLAEVGWRLARQPLEVPLEGPQVAVARLLADLGDALLNILGHVLELRYRKSADRFVIHGISSGDASTVVI